MDVPRKSSGCSTESCSAQQEWKQELDSSMHGILRAIMDGIRLSTTSRTGLILDVICSMADGENIA